MERVRKEHLIKMLHHKTGLSHEKCKKFVYGFVDVLRDCFMEGKSVTFYKLGRFNFYKRKARIARNIWTKEPIFVPEANHIKFRLNNELRKKIR